LAEILARQGKTADAAPALTKATELYRQLGAEEALATTLLKLCQVLHSSNAYPDMAAAALEALAIRQRQALADATKTPDLVLALTTTASALALAGQNAQALALSRDTVQTARGLGPGVTLGRALHTFAWIRSGLEEDVAAAVPAATEAMTLLAEHPALVDETKAVLAELHRLLRVQSTETVLLTPPLTAPPPARRKPWWRRIFAG
jgi:hypothetical protein